MDRADSRAAAVAVANGRIIAVGGEAEVLAHAGERTERVELAGRTMIPAFIDPHGHFPESGISALCRVELMCPPLGEIRRLDEVFARLAEKAAATPKGGWVFGVFFDQTTIEERRFPTATELDRVSRDHAVVVMHLSGHVCAVNSEALRRAGIRAGMAQPAGGHVEFDPKSGAPTGLLEEPAAMGPIPGAMFEAGRASFRDGLRLAAADYASHGVTTAQNAWADRAILGEFLAATRDRALPIRLTVLPDAELEPAIAAGDIDLERPEPDRLKIGPRKLFADGSIQVFTAYLSRPYHTPCRGDPGYRGYPVHRPAVLAERIGRLHRAGRQIHIHANGDAADDVLDAFEAALERTPRSDHRHTIIHGQTLRDDQLRRMAGLGMTASFFSYHVYVWGDRHLSLFLGPERAARINPAASAGRHGLRYTLHNDTPVTPMRPLPLIWCAVNRLTAGGRVLGAAERISPLQALRAHTIDAAWQVFREAELGSIEPGKSADFAILSKNPLDHAETIKDIRVETTISAGEMVFRRA
jgi:predicted amidohydrolase YtcJ